MHPWLLSGLITFGALQVGDLATTERAIRAGGVEQNPIYSHRPDRKAVLIKAGLMAGVTYTALKLPTKGGLTLTWGLNGVYAGVIWHNVNVAREHERRR
jgi:hypothetical protein